MSHTIRPATRADADTLVAFTLREAEEAEGALLDADAVRVGVLAAFTDAPRSVYWLAVDSEGTPVGATSVVKEWSNFHGGDYWWIQSLFIVPEHRGSGLLDSFLDHLAEVALAAGAIDLRLYAHTDNERALRAYRRCGFETAPYVIMRRQLTPKP